MLRGAGGNGDCSVSQYVEGVKPEIEILGKGRLRGESSMGELTVSDERIRESINIC
jgi:hypothetical protein